MLTSTGVKKVDLRRSFSARRCPWPRRAAVPSARPRRRFRTSACLRPRLSAARRRRSPRLKCNNVSFVKKQYWECHGTGKQRSRHKYTHLKGGTGTFQGERRTGQDRGARHQRSACIFFLTASAAAEGDDSLRATAPVSTTTSPSSSDAEDSTDGDGTPSFAVEPSRSTMPLP